MTRLRISPGRHPLLWGAGVVAVAFLAYGAAWLVAADQFREVVSFWIAQRQAEGYRIAFSELETRGFPALPRISLSDATIAGLPPRGAWSWSVDEAIVEASPLNPGRVTVRAPGAQRIERLLAARRIVYVGSAAEVTFDIVSDGQLPSGTARVRDLELEGADGDRVAAASIDIIARGDPTAPADERTATQGVTLAATGLRFPPTLALPLGDDVAEVALEAKLLGTLEVNPWPEALARWRDAGGTVEITRLQLVYGPLNLAADGTLALDAADQPIGAFNARIIGASSTVDSLHRRGLIAEGDAMAVKALAVLTSRKPPGGGPPVLQIPLTLQERTFYAGPLALAMVPEIRW